MNPATRRTFWGAIPAVAGGLTLSAQTKLFGAWPQFVMEADAKFAVRSSAERYSHALEVER